MGDGRSDGDGPWENAMQHRKWALALAASSLTGAAWAFGGETPLDLLGTPVPTTAAERRIEIDPATRWANVKQGESVLFVLGAQSFGWRFDGLPRSFNLQRVAPAGTLDRPLTVYVTPKVDPRRE
jgi:hypothetical protein